MIQSKPKKKIKKSQEEKAPKQYPKKKKLVSVSKLRRVPSGIRLHKSEGKKNEIQIPEVFGEHGVHHEVREKPKKARKERKAKAFLSSSAAAIHKTDIKVVGVGGAGSRIVSEMSRERLIPGVKFIAVNTDRQSLRDLKNAEALPIGQALTRGLGAGMNAELGREAAQSDQDKIQGALSGSDMVFLIAGLGGGIGSGAFPVIAETAKAVGALVVGIVTLPFDFEGSGRKAIAETALEDLEGKVNTLITISNNNLWRVIKRETPFRYAFGIIDKILKQAVEAIVDLIATPGLINVDFADIRAVMENGGHALIGIGQARGGERAKRAAQDAVSSPLLDVSLEGANGVLFSIAGGEDLKMLEVEEAAKIITNDVDPEAKIIFGSVKDERLKGKIRITLIATGLGKVPEKPARDLVEESKPGKHEEERMEIPAFIRRKIKGD